MKSVGSAVRNILSGSACVRAHALAIKLCLVPLLTLPSASLAQVLYGTLTGTITDKTGAVVPNVNVTLTSQDTGQVRTTTSNESGDYLLNNILPGTYTVSLQQPGFAGFTQKNITIEINRQARIDIVLQPAGTTQVVTVTGTTPILQTETAEVNHELTSEQIGQLPVTSSQGRNFQALYTLIPGAATSWNRTRPLPTRRAPCRSTSTASKT